MALDHVRLSVVQCLESHHDVTAFLRALPASSLDAPLTALLTLLTKSWTFKEYWPEIIPDLLTAKTLEVAVTAVTALPAIFIYDDVGYQKHQSNIGALQWLANFTHLGKAIDRSMVGNFKRHVKRYDQLESVQVYVDAFVRLAPSLPPRLRHLTFVRDEFDDDSEISEDSEDSEDSEESESESEDFEDSEDDSNEFDDGSATFCCHRDDVSEDSQVDSHDESDKTVINANLATALQQWLGNGRSHKHVTFNCALTKGDAAAVADVLVSSTSIKTLEMNGSVELVEALLARTEPLPHLTGFKITGSSVDEAKQLVARLDATKLTQLQVGNMADLNWVLPLLPTMPNLQDLSLIYGQLDEVPPTLTGATPRLRALTLHGVSFPDTAIDAIFQTLRHWIHTTGVTNVSLVHCKLERANVIASVLQSSPRSSALTFMDIGDIGDDFGCLHTLIQSIAHLVNTTVQVAFEMSTRQFKSIKTTALLNHGVTSSTLIQY
ncbi:hypothetical protein SPRG_17462 [Saprolegnia parasitica CBS 223.65]|uniref:Uncharacterized protein n=1 Tax=Saprolegnia parasitica (strain CBS 223.65) TaxID=695850 RepID=A0A067BR24_SAPPC|nr:hypothetical protein SPRG_17462 [Saprolegnia parasitica CBS 223.65]KDO17127.1 hypothetical protein SPRG_17462 [Saprolegnia parasitica CBS 223.65]|eukprot:XP_012212165.1 hypothetical protein SPRG_17462 [Saprolegnia parasitica CBS 223.65]